MFFTFYHGTSSPFFTTIWENMFGSLFPTTQQANLRRTPWFESISLSAGYLCNLLRTTPADYPSIPQQEKFPSLPGRSGEVLLIFPERSKRCSWNTAAKCMDPKKSMSSKWTLEDTTSPRLLFVNQFVEDGGKKYCHSIIQI